MTAAAGTAVVSWAHVGGTGHHSLVGRQALGLVCRPPSAAEGPRLLSSPPPAPKAHCSTYLCAGDPKTKLRRTATPVTSSQTRLLLESGLKF